MKRGDLVAWGAAVVFIAAVLMLSACMGTPRPAATIACPPVKPYTAAQQKALSAAWASVPAGSPLDSAMTDYLALRDVARACAASVQP